MFNFNVLAGYSADFLHKTKEILLHLARERYPRVSLEEVRLRPNMRQNMNVGKLKKETIKLFVGN